MFKPILPLLLLFAFHGAACQPKTGVTENPKQRLLAGLEAAKGKGILFGHQDDLAYGVGWKYVAGESDVKRIAGDYPALFGWELGGLELGHEVNLDSVPFRDMKRLAEWVDARGGINTFSWHPHSPIDSVDAWHPDAVVVKHIVPGGHYHQAFNRQLDRLASFFLSLNDSAGNPIPFIFRPWHEMDGNWFWWGQKNCSPDELKALFAYTVGYLRAKGLTAMVVAYSPDCHFERAAEYLKWYPGDDQVDILGMDNYWDLKQPGGENDAIRKLHVVIDLAKQKHKLAALTETGLELVPDSTWYSTKLGAVLNNSVVAAQLSYVMVWRNASTRHFFFPYPGHPAAADARKLLGQPNLMLLNQFNQSKN